MIVRDMVEKRKSTKSCAHMTRGMDCEKYRNVGAQHWEKVALRKARNQHGKGQQQAIVLSRCTESGQQEAHKARATAGAHLARDLLQDGNVRIEGGGALQ